MAVEWWVPWVSSLHLIPPGKDTAKAFKLEQAQTKDSPMPNKNKNTQTNKQNLVHPKQRLRKKVAKDRKSFGQYPPTIFFSPLHFFLRLSKSFSCICVVYFWLLYFVSLINMSIPLPKPLSVSYCGCRVVLNVG